MLSDAITSVSGLLTTAINRIWPNPEDKAKSEAVIMAATAEAAIRELEAAQRVMIAEAQSADPWTSRARPSFMYVIYVLLLASIPMGVLHAFQPDVAGKITAGFSAWIHAIPDSLMTLFGVGYLGYTGARTFEKRLTMKGK